MNQTETHDYSSSMSRSDTSESQNSNCPKVFASVTETYKEMALDLNEHLISKPHATFFIHAKTSDMAPEGIFKGDLLIIDRSLTPKDGNIVLAELNGEFIIRRFIKRWKSILLIAENPKLSPIEISNETELQISGVITFVIHKL